VLSYGEIIRKHFSRVPEHVRGTDERPICARSVGPLEAAPTVVAVVRLIGREMNLLDRAGVTTNPDYSDYTTDAGRRRLALRVLRQGGTAAVTAATRYPARTVRRFLVTGRTKNDRWPKYFDVASQIARDALTARGEVQPTTNEALWRASLRLAKGCLGCGAALTGKQRKWCQWCRSSSGRLRRQSIDGTRV
jgi:hypothetical protein